MEHNERITGPDFVRPDFVRPDFVSGGAPQSDVGSSRATTRGPGEQDSGGADVSRTGVAETTGAGETQGTVGRAQDAAQGWLAGAAQFVRDNPWPVLAAAFAVGLALSVPRTGARAMVASVGQGIRRQTGDLADTLSGAVGDTDSVATGMESSPQSTGTEPGTSASGTVATMRAEP